MKIVSKVACLVVLPVAASAQVELIAGWNFGQFISSIVPSTDGTTGDAVGFIPSNFTGTQRPGPGSSGPEHIIAGDSSTFSLGSGIISWDGSNGSHVWSFADGSGVYVDNNPETYSSVNGGLVTSNDLAAGQTSNFQLRFTSSGGVEDFAITVDTSGYADYDDGAYSQTNDYNFSFAASGSGSVSFFYGGLPVGTSIGVTATETAYNVDLPGIFYGNASSTLIARISGAVTFDNIQINGVQAVPEPSTCAALAGLAGLASVMVRRRRR